MRNEERSSEWPWLITGTLLLIASCVLLLLVYRDTAGQFPIPMHQAVFYFFMPYSVLFVLPLAFWGSFGFLWQSKQFGVLVLAIVTVVGLLDALWLAEHWGLGYRYQGGTLTQGVTIANALGLGTVATLSVIGILERSKAFSAAAYFVLFEVLVFFAFPFLGPHAS
jgi:hypothetical protein